jgi:hypothetical protein
VGHGDPPEEFMPVVIVGPLIVSELVGIAETGMVFSVLDMVK